MIAYKNLASPLIPVCLEKSHMRDSGVQYLQGFCRKLFLSTTKYAYSMETLEGLLTTRTSVLTSNFISFYF